MMGEFILQYVNTVNRVRGTVHPFVLLLNHRLVIAVGGQATATS